MHRSVTIYWKWRIDKRVGIGEMQKARHDRGEGAGKEERRDRGRVRREERHDIMERGD